MKLLITFSIFIMHSYSLEIGEKIDSIVEKILPENVIVFKGGKSDHVRGFDQVKIFDGDDFVARGLSVGAGRYRAGWKIFRVVRPRAIKEGKKLKLVTVNTQDVAWEYIDKPISHYRQIVIDYYPSSSYTRIDEGDFSRVNSKVLFKEDE